MIACFIGKLSSPHHGPHYQVKKILLWRNLGMSSEVVFYIF